jgi:RNA polymerase sigma-70 factor (ECF subfamily)
MNPEASAHLVSQFNRGNSKAFASLFQIYFPVISYFSRSFISRMQEAEDIASEVFLKLWELRGNFENIDKIKSFLYLAARNKCLDYLRHEKVKSKREEEIIRLLSTEDNAFLEKEMIAAELKARMYAAIEKLPFKCRQIFNLHYISGLTNEEIAVRLQISAKTVSNQKLLALKRLRLDLLK